MLCLQFGKTLAPDSEPSNLDGRISMREHKMTMAYELL
jgi:hypothetical protein